MISFSDVNKQPCPKECPNRSATCRRTCAEWQEYEKIHQAEQKEKDAQLEKNTIYFSYMSDVQTKNMKAEIRARKNTGMKVRDSKK